MVVEAEADRPRPCCEVSSTEAREDIEGVDWTVQKDGAVVVRGAVSAETTRAALEHVNMALGQALAASGETSMAPSGSCSAEAERDKQTAEMEADARWFGMVQARAYRRDLKLQLCPAVTAAVKELLHTVGGCLSGLLTADAILCELSALCVDPGAAAQNLHPDTRIIPGQDQASLVTAFLALQDIAPDMGPTEVLLRSHTAEAHEVLSGGGNPSYSSTRGLEGRQAQPVPLRAGDVLLMDSRLWHRGGPNVSSRRRNLLYVTLQVPGNAPPGSTYSLLDEYTGRFRLKNLCKWTDPTAVNANAPSAPDD